MISNPSEVPTPVPAPVCKKRILIVDDHPLFRLGIAALISEQTDLAVCGEAQSVSEALDAIRRLQPDAVLLDLSLPGTSGTEHIGLMRAEQPGLPMLVVSLHDESQRALPALRAGANGYVMKGEGEAQILIAVRRVLGGQTYAGPSFRGGLAFKTFQALEAGKGSSVDRLSEREREVFHHVGQSLSTRQIADVLQVSAKTVETHRARIKEKLEFTDANEMVRFARDWLVLQGSVPALENNKRAGGMPVG